VDADELYGLALDRFVGERTALARELRAGGDREQAGSVAALRKPSVAAWAVNQLVRTQSLGFEELIEAGDALGAAQANLVAGRVDAGALREAVERERGAVAALVGIARGLLSGDGHELSAAILDRVADTLHAAALDTAAREEVRGGRLVRELQHVGLGGLAGSGDGGGGEGTRTGRRRTAGRGSKAPPASATRKRATAPTAGDKPTEARRPAVAEARRAPRIAEAEARRHADLTTRALRVAEERHVRAADALRAADEALANAQAEAKNAAAAHEQAKAELEGLD
jgi:hypothetical protein